MLFNQTNDTGAVIHVRVLLTRRNSMHYNHRVSYCSKKGKDYCYPYCTEALYVVFGYKKSSKKGFRFGWKSPVRVITVWLSNALQPSHFRFGWKSPARVNTVWLSNALRPSHFRFGWKTRARVIIVYLVRAFQPNQWHWGCNSRPRVINA